MPAALSTREGIRLWWWLSGGDGSDQRGAMSVKYAGGEAATDRTRTAVGPAMRSYQRVDEQASQNFFYQFNLLLPPRSAKIPPSSS